MVNLARYARRPLEVMQEWQARYGDIFTVRYPAVGRGVYVADPHAIRDLLTGDQTDLRAGEGNAFLQPILGPHSLLLLDGAEHTRQRRVLLPPFKGTHVRDSRAFIREAAEREIGDWRPGRTIVLRDRMRRLTFDVICHAAFGVTDRARVAQLRAALIAVIDSSPAYLLVARFAQAGGGRCARRLRTADALLFEEIANRRADPDLESRTDVLSRLLLARHEDGQPLEDREVRDHLFTVLGAGYETTATALAFAFEFLLQNPHTLARLREELPHDDGYLHGVVKETLRLRPVIGHVPRVLTRARDIAGWELPAGTKVHPVMTLLHLREDLFTRAHEFRPERFCGDAPGRGGWLPFGGGVRRCLGGGLAQAEMAEVLRVVCPAVSLCPVRDRPDPVVLRGVTLAPRHGVEVDVV
jgi:cytochrome P450